MGKAAISIQVIVWLILALVVLAVVLIFVSAALGREIFPGLGAKIKAILGLWNVSVPKV